MSSSATCAACRAPLLSDASFCATCGHKAGAPFVPRALTNAQALADFLGHDQALVADLRGMIDAVDTRVQVYVRLRIQEALAPATVDQLSAETQAKALVMFFRHVGFKGTFISLTG